MSYVSAGILESTLTALESSLQVRLIASFGLRTCQSAGDSTEVLEAERFKEFDQIPVVSGSSVVGVLERSTLVPRGSVSLRMRPLQDGLLVSADEALSKFIPTLAHDGYRLVVDGTNISGIVTRSDLHKLPVRIVAFCLVAHLENLLAELIQRRCQSENAGISHLSSHRQKELHAHLKRLKNHRLDPSLLEVSGFLDKRDVVERLYVKELGDDATSFQDELADIKDLRDSVAHGANYANNDDEMRTFVMRLQQTQSWIDRLGRLLSTSTQSVGA